MSKKFQSRIVLGKNEYLYTAGRAARVVQERSGSACHTSIKSRPTISLKELTQSEDGRKLDYVNVKCWTGDLHVIA